MAGRVVEEWAKVLSHRGLTALGMSVAEAQTLPQNDLKKQGLAWLVRTATVVSGDWVRARLCMGHRSNVSRAVQRLQIGKGEAVEMGAMLQPCKDPFSFFGGIPAEIQDPPVGVYPMDSGRESLDNGPK
jgi:hypothetical protein